MAKLLPDSTINGMHSWIRERITGVSVNSTQPTNYTEATATYELATTNGLTSTDLTLGNGDTSGRKITLSEQAGLTIDTTGGAAHVSWWGSSGSTLLLVTTTTTQQLTTGGTVTIPAHDFEVRDAA